MPSRSTANPAQIERTLLEQLQHQLERATNVRERLWARAVYWDRVLVAERKSAAIAALCMLVLTGCAREHGRIEGPPLYVHLCDAMPTADAEAWGAAAGALNLELEEAAFWVGHGPPEGCSTVDVCPSGAVLADAEVREGACVITVRYAPGSAHDVARVTFDELLGAP